ncbi:MAG: glycine oxidase ThiO [Thiobacillaceae bacterium]
MTHNVLIIGAGVSGLSVALTLLQRGDQVTLLERGQVGAESSWAGGGILSPLLPWDYSSAVSALALRSMVAYPAWIKHIEALSGLETEYWRCGMLAQDCAATEATLAWCAEHDLACELIAAATPASKPALRLPGIAQVRNPRLVAALLKAVKTLGGRVIEHAQVTALTTQSSRATGAVTAGATYTADRIILASGAWAGTGLENLPAVPNIRPVRGQMLLYKLEPGTLDTILYRNGTYLIPRRDGHVLAGSTLEDAGFDKSTTAEAHDYLHGEASSMLPVLSDMKPVQQWSGLRPGSPDNIPVIDRHPDFDNVFVNTGHFRYGVTMAPASAELLLDLMEGNMPSIDPAPYCWQAALARRW